MVIIGLKLILIFDNWNPQRRADRRRDLDKYQFLKVNNIRFVSTLTKAFLLVKIGDQLPSFNLKGVDNNQHSDGDQNGKCLVVIFTCNHCPYAQAYISRISELRSAYSAEDVSIVAINPNDDVMYPQDSFENMIPMADHLGLGALYLRDDSQDIAKAFDAARTPEVFVFGQDRKLEYRGAIDDNWENSSGVSNRYLNDAIDALLQGSNVDNKETGAIGCSVKWK